MMSLSVDAIREEILERRSRAARLAQEIETHERRVADLERNLSGARASLASVRARIAHEDRAVDALQAAAAVLGERLPDETETMFLGTGDPPTSIPAPPPVEARTLEPTRPREGSSPERPPMPAPLLAADVGPGTLRLPPARRPTRPPERRSKKQRRGPATPATPDSGKPESPGVMSPELVAAADAVVRELRAADGPVASRSLVKSVRDAVGCGRRVADEYLRAAVGHLLAVGRVRVASESPPTWELSPGERASAGLGVGEYEGRTTRWPTESTSPTTGTRIVVEPTAYESKR